MSRNTIRDFTGGAKAVLNTKLTADSTIANFNAIKYTGMRWVSSEQELYNDLYNSEKRIQTYAEDIVAKKSQDTMAAVETLWDYVWDTDSSYASFFTDIRLQIVTNKVALQQLAEIVKPGSVAANFGKSPSDFQLMLPDVDDINLRLNLQRRGLEGRDLEEMTVRMNRLRALGYTNEEALALLDSAQSPEDIQMFKLMTEDPIDYEAMFDIDPEKVSPGMMACIANHSLVLARSGNTQGLQDMTNGMLDLSGIEQGDLTLDDEAWAASQNAYGLVYLEQMYIQSAIAAETQNYLLYAGMSNRTLTLEQYNAMEAQCGTQSSMAAYWGQLAVLLNRGDGLQVGNIEICCEKPPSISTIDVDVRLQDRQYNDTGIWEIVDDTTYLCDGYDLQEDGSIRLGTWIKSTVDGVKDIQALEKLEELQKKLDDAWLLYADATIQVLLSACPWAKAAYMGVRALAKNEIPTLKVFSPDSDGTSRSTALWLETGNNVATGLTSAINSHRKLVASVQKQEKDMWENWFGNYAYGYSGKNNGESSWHVLYVGSDYNMMMKQEILASQGIGPFLDPLLAEYLTKENFINTLEEDMKTNPAIAFLLYGGGDVSGITSEQLYQAEQTILTQYAKMDRENTIYEVLPTAGEISFRGSFVAYTYKYAGPDYGEEAG